MATKFLQAILTDEERNKIPVASEELYLLAKNKAKELTPNTQIRLTAHNESWYLFNFAGSLYIGREINSQIQPFFKTMSRSELNMTDKNGSITYYVQPLFKNR